MEEDSVFIIYDLETTGLDSDEDRIIQISCEIVDSQENILGEYSTYINPQQSLSKDVIELTGITDEMLQSYEPWDTACHALVEFIYEQRHTKFIWVSHNNFNFDSLFLLKTNLLETKLCELDMYFADSLWIARECLHREHDNKLSSLYSHLFPKDTDKYTFHSAVVDMKILEKIWFHPWIRPHWYVKLKKFRRGEQLLHSLTTEQEEIIHSKPLESNICIMAGAGCAKTTTIVERIAFLIEHHPHIRDSNIMFMTFTRDAANDMTARLEKRLNRCSNMWIGTIDSIAYQILSSYSKDLFDSCKEIGDYKRGFLQFLRKQYCPFRQELLDKIHYVFVDEFQDIHEIYYEILKEFNHHGSWLTVIGDALQNIYSWNGSDSKYLSDFSTYFKGHTRFYTLSVNFRSTPEIITLSNYIRRSCSCELEIQSQQCSQGIKPYVHASLSWEKQFEFILDRIHYLHEYLDISYGEMVILSRSNTPRGELYFIENKLMERKIPTQLLHTYEDHRKKIIHDRLLLSTIHKSKGLEFRVVFVIGLTEGSFPSARSMDIQEERRLYYVAITRAKDYLYCLTVCNSKKEISSFLVDSPSSYFQWNKFANHLRERFFQKTIDPKETNMYPVDEFLSVSQFIHRIRMSDIRHHPCFPSLDLLQEIRIHEEFEYPMWVHEHELYPIFSVWIRHIILRIISESDHKVVLQNHSITRLLNPMTVSKPLYSMYQKYGYYFASTDKMELDSILSDWISFLSNENIPEKDRDALHLLFHKIQLQMNKSKLSVSDIMVRPYSFLLIPEHYSQSLRLAYTMYQDTSKSWKEILFDIFHMSWYSEIYSGRKKVLHVDWSQIPLSNSIDCLIETIQREFITPFITSNHIHHFRYNVRFFTKELWCDCDVIDMETATYYLIKPSKNKPSVEDWINMLIMKHIIEQNISRIVQFLVIYNPLLGTLFRLDVKDWTHTSSLYNYLMTAQQNTIYTDKEEDVIPLSTPKKDREMHIKTETIQEISVPSDKFNFKWTELRVDF